MSDRNVEISKKLVLKNTVGTAAGKILQLTILVWAYQYLVRRISPEEYSVYAVIMSVVAFLPTLTSVLTSGVARYSVEAYAKGDLQRVTQITSTMSIATLVAGFVVSVVGTVFVWHIDSLLTVAPAYVNDARIMAGLLIFSVAVSVAVAPFAVGLYMRQRLAEQNALFILSTFLRLAIMLVLLLGVSTRAVWVVVATVCANLSYLLVIVLFSRKLVPALCVKRDHWRTDMIKQMTSFGGWNFAERLSLTIQHHVDPLILNRLASPMDVTAFHIGAIPTRQILYGWGQMSTVIGPPLIAMHATSQHERLGKAFVTGNRYASWFLLLFAVPIIIFHREIITLYAGPSYTGAGRIMALLLLGVAAHFTNLMTYPVLHARARLKGLGIARLATRTLTILLTLYLVGVRQWGALGAAMSNAGIMIISEALVFWPLGLRATGISLRQYLRDTLIPVMIPAVASAATLLLIREYLRPAGWLEVGLCSVFGVAVYGSTLGVFCLRPYDRAELTRLTGVMKRRLFPVAR